MPMSLRLQIEHAVGKIEEYTDRREHLLRLARAEGQSLRQLAEWSGLSKDTVHTITRTDPKES